MAMDEEDTEPLKALIEIRGFIKTVKDKGIEHPVLDALDQIALGEPAEEALGIKVPSGGRALKTQIKADRKMRVFQGLIAALEAEGMTRSEALDQIFEGVEEGERGPFGWTRETAETAASKGNHLRREFFSLRL